MVSRVLKRDWIEKENFVASLFVQECHEQPFQALHGDDTAILH